MEAAAAWEVEQRADDAAAGGFDARLGVGQVGGVQHHQGAAALRGAVEEAAAEAAVAELAVIRAVVLEAPVEGLAVEGLGRGDRGDGEFQVVDAVLLVGAVYGGLREKGGQSPPPRRRRLGENGQLSARAAAPVRAG